MYSRHTGFMTRRSVPSLDRVRPPRLTNVSVNKREARRMRRGWPNKPNTMKVYCRRRNFSRACSPWIMRSCIWTRSPSPRPNSSRPLILISCWENKASSYERRGRCGEAQAEQRRGERRRRRRHQTPRNDSASSSQRTTQMKKPSRKTMTANNPYSLTRNTIRRIMLLLSPTATNKKR